MAPLRHAKSPCRECPWRRDVTPGKFEACRYDALRGTSGSPGAEAALDAPMFACHMSPEGREYACAGWLAAVGRNHLGVRLAVATGRLDPAVLDPRPGWPPLFGTYEEMAAVQARREEQQQMPQQSITRKYPDVHVQLTGRNGNAMMIIGAVSAALRREVGGEAASEFAAEAMDQASYEDLLRFVRSTVEVS